MTFAEKFRWLCALHHKPQVQVVRALARLGVDVSKSTVGRWSTGGGLPDLAEAAALGRLFDVSVDFLAHDELEMPSATRAFPSPVAPVKTGVSRRRLTPDYEKSPASADHAKRRRKA